MLYMFVHVYVLLNWYFMFLKYINLYIYFL